MVRVAVAIIGLTRTNTVEVPEVTGKSLDTATRMLEKEGFAVDQVDRVARQAPVGRVVEQDPGGETDKDCSFLGWFCSNPSVNLTVSNGPGQVQVPDVSGSSSDDGEQTLTDAGLVVTVTDQSSADVAEGTVIDTDPAAGESVAPGSQVTMYVSSGVKQVSVPPVVGQTLGAAAQQLAAKGLEYDSTEEQSERPAGEVISQSPNAGTKVEPGSTVEMVVSSGPPDNSVSVPSVVGLTQSAAESKVESLGLVATVQTEPTTIQPQDGKVINQSPDSGTSLSTGSQVVITVGVYSADPGATGNGSDSGGITP